MSEQTQALYAPGQEPEELRHRINQLLANLDSVYPDKIVKV